MEETPPLTPERNEETLNPQGTQTEQPVESPSEGPEIQTQEEIDYKQRYAEARKGAEDLLHRDKEKDQKIADLESKLAQASESSLEKRIQVKFPDWDLMTESERAIAKNQELISKELADLKEEKAWEKDFAKARAKFPKLADKSEAFKEYCYKYPKSIDAETLAKSFLFDDTTPVKEPVVQRKGLEKPTAGPNKISTPGMSLEDIKRLRENEPRKYAKLIQEGRLVVPKE